MIHFVCICGEPFDVPMELAGDSMQCPVCRRLLDVPLLGQQGTFEDDGTVRLADADDAFTDVEEKMRVFGHAEDLRSSYDEFLIAGDAPENEPPRRPVPRYDPITGELMLPLALQNDDAIRPQPVFDTTSPVLGYAQTATQGKTASSPAEEIGWWSAPWRIVSGMGAVAVAVVFTLHAMIVLGLAIPGFNVFFALIALLILVTIAAHYANTMEDIGPNGRDRVPVLLRTASVHEDIVGPLFYVFFSLLYAFAPLILTAILVPYRIYVAHLWVPMAEVAWGLLVFPLAVFTMVNSGVLANLTPRRMASVVVAAPIRYTLAAGTFYAATAAYVVAFGSMSPPQIMNAMAPPPTSQQVTSYAIDMGVTLGVFALAVYLMHLAAFWFGLLYRAKHEDFAWVMQRHERAYSPETVAQMMQRRPRQRGGAVANRNGAKPVVPLPALPAEPHTGFEVKLPGR